MHQIIYARSTQKDLDKVPNAAAEKIRQAVKTLAYNPMPYGYKKLSGGSGLYRIKEGDYRIVYTFSSDEKKIWITRIRHRKDSYRYL